jgi:hypothetical protein
MRIMFDQAALDTMSRDLAGAANRLHELAATVRNAVESIDLPARASHTVRFEVEAAVTAIRTTADTLAAESTLLSHKSACCGGGEGGGTGALPTLAMESWASSVPSAADTALGLSGSALTAALSAAILGWQASGSPGLASADDGFTVINMGPIAEFEQIGVGSGQSFGTSPSERVGLVDAGVGLGNILAPTGSWMAAVGIVDQANPYADIMNVLAAPRRSSGSILDGIDLTPAITRRVTDHTFGLDQPGASPLPGGIVDFMYNAIVSGERG